MALDVLEKYQIENLIDHLLVIYPNDLDTTMIESLKQRVLESPLEASYLTREISELFKGDKNKLEGFLTKYQVPLKDLQASNKKTEEEVKLALNMQDVTDFTRDGKTYIKITYADGRVQMIENRNGKDTKQTFEDVQKLKAINNMDGTQNAEAAFQELLKDYIEVPFENSMFLKQEKLGREAQAKLNFVEAQFPKNQVLASPEENIFVVKGNPDITIEVVEKDGIYRLRQLEEFRYGVREETDVQSFHEDSKTIEEPSLNEVIEQPNEQKESQEMERLELATEGMTEQEIVEYLRIHGKNPQQIMMTLLALEERKEAKRRKQEEPVLEKPKQMVLTNSNMQRKIAGFVDAMTLAFFVGVLSGTLFFAMLHLFLKYLY